MRRNTQAVVATVLALSLIMIARVGNTMTGKEYLALSSSEQAAYLNGIADVHTDYDSSLNRSCVGVLLSTGRLQTSVKNRLESRPGNIDLAGMVMRLIEVNCSSRGVGEVDEEEEEEEEEEQE